MDVSVVCTCGVVECVSESNDSLESSRSLLVSAIRVKPDAELTEEPGSRTVMSE